jgi:Flp pilus assembly protein TadB
MIHCKRESFPALAGSDAAGKQSRIYLGEIESPKNESLRQGRKDSLIRDSIFIVLFFVLLVVWGLSWAAFHIAGGLIHLLLVVAVIFLLLHFFRRRTSV